MRSSLRWLLIPVAATAASDSPTVAGDRMQAHVRFLSANELEGRGIGTSSESLATSYIATRFQLAGAMPAGQAGTFYQMVPPAGVRTRRTASITAVRPGVQLSFGWLDDSVGNSRKQTAREQVAAEAVFAGYGIVAPEFDWDDYKDVDVNGKIVFLFTGEPASDDPKGFAGEALAPIPRALDVIAAGAERTTLRPLVEKGVRRSGWSFLWVQ